MIDDRTVDREILSAIQSEAGRDFLVSVQKYIEATGDAVADVLANDKVYNEWEQSLSYWQQLNKNVKRQLDAFLNESSATPPAATIPGLVPLIARVYGLDRNNPADLNRIVNEKAPLVESVATGLAFYAGVGILSALGSFFGVSIDHSFFAATGLFALVNVAFGFSHRSFYRYKPAEPGVDRLGRWELEPAPATRQTRWNLALRGMAIHAPLLLAFVDPFGGLFLAPLGALASVALHAVHNRAAARFGWTALTAGHAPARKGPGKGEDGTDPIRLKTPQDKYVPMRGWRYADVRMGELPRDKQGWKFHISLTPDDADRVLDAILPVLWDLNIPHKVADGLEMLEFLKDYETQAAKGITIYLHQSIAAQIYEKFRLNELKGKSVEPYEISAIFLGMLLEKRLADAGIGEVPGLEFHELGTGGDKRFSDRSHGRLGYRYGAFEGREVALPNGEIVPDERERYKHSEIKATLSADDIRDLMGPAIDKSLPSEPLRTELEGRLRATEPKPVTNNVRVFTPQDIQAWRARFQEITGRPMNNDDLKVIMARIAQRPEDSPLQLVTTFAHSVAPVSPGEQAVSEYLEYLRNHPDVQRKALKLIAAVTGATDPTPLATPEIIRRFVRSRPTVHKILLSTPPADWGGYHGVAINLVRAADFEQKPLAATIPGLVPLIAWVFNLDKNNPADLNRIVNEKAPLVESLATGVFFYASVGLMSALGSFFGVSIDHSFFAATGLFALVNVAFGFSHRSVYRYKPAESGVDRLGRWELEPAPATRQTRWNLALRGMAIHAPLLLAFMDPFGGLFLAPLGALASVALHAVHNRAAARFGWTALTAGHAPTAGPAAPKYIDAEGKAVLARAGAKLRASVEKLRRGGRLTEDDHVTGMFICSNNESRSAIAEILARKALFKFNSSLVPAAERDQFQSSINAILPRLEVTSPEGTVTTLTMRSGMKLDFPEDANKVLLGPGPRSPEDDSVLLRRPGSQRFWADAALPRRSPESQRIGRTPGSVYPARDDEIRREHPARPQTRLPDRLRRHQGPSAGRSSRRHGPRGAQGPGQKAWI
ncbi:MAG: hypothetical protein IPP68_03540 [Elusimicrobia bacterium]|nr:hypothetical protein [Elusimicrobiota bacterium]